MAKLCNLVFFDLKIMDRALHFHHTGVDNAIILNNLRALSTMDVPFVIRTPLVPGVTDTEENLNAIAQCAAQLRGLVRVDLDVYKRQCLSRKFIPQNNNAARGKESHDGSQSAKR